MLNRLPRLAHLAALTASLGAQLAGAAEPGALAAARALHEAGRFAEARRAFERLAASDPKNPEIAFHRGELALWRNELPEAVALLEKATATGPGNSRYHHRLGDAYGRSAQAASVFSALGFARKCLAAYRRAVELDPANLEARLSLFLFYASAPGIIGGSAEKATAEAAAIKQLDAETGRVASAALWHAQKRFDAARAELATLRPRNLAAVTTERVFLSDVAWSGANVGWGEPARNHTWPDLNAWPGVVLIVQGRMYAKGLYAHAPSRYAYALDGRWKRFSATVGLRDGAHEQGAAIFTVRGDGRELFRSTQLRVGKSERVQVDLTGVKELELLTESGLPHNHNSWAVWVSHC